MPGPSDSEGILSRTELDRVRLLFSQIRSSLTQPRLAILSYRLALSFPPRLDGPALLYTIFSLISYSL